MAVRVSLHWLSTLEMPHPLPAVSYFAAFLLLSLVGGVLLAFYLFQFSDCLCRWLGLLTVSFILLLGVLLTVGTLLYPEIAIGGVAGMVLTALACTLFKRRKQP